MGVGRARLSGEQGHHVLVVGGQVPEGDDGRQYAECLRNAGVAVGLRNAPRLIHGWLRGRAMSEDAATEFKAICKALKRFLQIEGAAPERK